MPRRVNASTGERSGFISGGSQESVDPQRVLYDLPAVSVTVRVLLSVVLLAVGLGLPAWAIKTRGAPWSFQERDAVVLSSAGNVEIYGGPAREGGSGSVDVKPGVALYGGDEVRVGALSRVVVRTPRTELELADGARAIFGEGGQLTLARGLVLVELAEGEPLVVDIEGGLGSVELAPGAYRLLANGQGRCFVLVERGVAKAGAAWADGGRLLALEKEAAPRSFARPDAVPLDAALDVANGVVKGTTASGAQLYVNGKLVHARDDGSFSEALPPGDADVVLYARDAAGNVERRVLRRPGGGRP